MNAQLGDELERLGDTCSEWGAARAMNDFRAAFGHKSCVVREGAVFGAARLAQRFPVWSPDVVRLLSDIEQSDDSPGVREAAREALEDLQ